MTQTKAELLQTRHQGDIRLGDADSTHYVGFKAPSTVSSSLVWTLPAADGTANYLLKTDGSGNLGWVADSSTDSTKMPLAGGTFTGDVTFTGDSSNGLWDKSASAFVANLTGTASGNAVLTGSTNNTIVTVTGANALTGEANLTFNGSSLGIGTNGTITTGSNFSLNGNALTVTGSAGTVIEGKRAGSATIQATNTTNSTDLQLRADATGGLVRTASNNPLVFGTNQTERMRIDASGRLLVGQTSGLSLYANGLFQVSAIDGNAALAVNRWSDNSSSPYLNFGKSRSGTVGTYTIVQSGDRLGQINFTGADGTDLASPAAGIAAYVDGTPGSNDMPGRIVFFTTPDGSATETERFRISSTGVSKFTGGIAQVATAAGALDLDLNTSNYFTKTISGNSTFTFSNPAASGTVTAFTLELTHSSGTVTWPSSVKWNADTAPTLTTGKTHLFMFVTDDGGSRYRGSALVDYVN
jgi:hypothetical protein